MNQNAKNSQLIKQRKNMSPAEKASVNVARISLIVLSSSTAMETELPTRQRAPNPGALP